LGVVLSALVGMWLNRPQTIERPATDDKTMNPNDRSAPKLLASGPTFAIHWFRGFVTDNFVEQVVSPGIVLMHNNFATGTPQWLVEGGIYARNTRRISYYLNVITGVVLSDRHLIVAAYSGMSMDHVPDPASGDVQLLVTVFDKHSGARLDVHVLGVVSSLSDSPLDPIGAGNIQHERANYSVKGILFRVTDTGQVEQL
jgi:hypothetical protein